ncbi:hypothetical protein ASE41_16880 [Streptomyces sp. Root264]|nr:hypothetical protein ASE41_16880 [Streptomyces sp. Root264]
MPSTWPAGSMRRAGFLRAVAGMCRTVRTTASAATGRFSQNTERHSSPETRRPPTAGPAPKAIEATAPHTAIARDRTARSG